jgi:preprotein translocase subunit SecD
MKTIYSFSITFLILALFAMGFTNEKPSKTRILIQSSDKNISVSVLDRSAQVITGRLKDFNSGQFELSVIKQKNQIEVTLIDCPDLKSAEKLISHKGSSGFYETYDHKGLSELLNGDNRLFSMLKIDDPDNSGHGAGCISVSDVSKVNDLLKSLALDKKCKFAWSQNSEKQEMCLYALRSDSKKGAVIIGSEIESASYKDDRIQISLKEGAVKEWSDATHRNLGKVIAVVLDDQVIASPKVMTAIDSGKIEISGSYKAEEAKFIAAILNNGELPANFFIVK